jgi:hypothetical protein
MCAEDLLDPNCALTDQILQYSTAVASFKIDSNLETFMDFWRSTPPETTTTGGHLSNISTGEVLGFMGGWVQKVVACSDLPAWDMADDSTYAARMFGSDGADANVQAW